MAFKKIAACASRKLRDEAEMTSRDMIKGVVMTNEIARLSAHPRIMKSTKPMARFIACGGVSKWKWLVVERHSIRACLNGR